MKLLTAIMTTVFTRLNIVFRKEKARKIDKYPDESPTFKPTAAKLLELAKSS